MAGWRGVRGFVVGLIALIWSLPQSRMPDVDSCSEYLVLQKLVDSQGRGLEALVSGMRGPVEYQGWPIDCRNAAQVERNAILPHYDSHFGLQSGMLALEFVVLEPVLRHFTSTPVSVGYWLLALQTRLLCAIVLLWFAHDLSRELGSQTFWIAACYFSASSWLCVFSGRLYWQLWMLYLPTVVLFHYYPMWQGRPKLTWAVLAGLFFVKMLVSYEFLPAMIVSAMMPVVYWELRDGCARRAVVAVMCVGLTSIIAFALAVSVHATQLSLCKSQSWGESLHDIYTVAKFRSGVDSGGRAMPVESAYFPPYREATVWDIFWGHVKFNVIGLPSRLGIPTAFVYLIGGVASFWLFYRVRETKERRRVNAVVAAYLVLGGAALVQVLLQRNHAWCHPGIYGIVFVLFTALVLGISMMAWKHVCGCRQDAPLAS